MSESENLKKLEAFKEMAKGLPPITPWNEIEVGETYHLPPLCVVTRKELTVKEINGDEMKYAKEGDKKDAEDHIMHRTSLMAKFIVKLKEY